MEPDHCTTFSSNDCADGPTSIKEEPNANGDGPQSEVHLADTNYCEVQDYKYDVPIINIAPIVTSSSCVSGSDEDHLTVKSEPEVGHYSTETSIETAVKSEVVTNMLPNLHEVKNESPCPIHTAVKSEVVTDMLPNLHEVKNESPCPIHTAVKSEVVTDIPKLYEVKNESSCSTHTKIVHNSIDAGSELVEVPGELDCKPEIIDNVGILGDVNIQTSVQHNDTVNHKPLLTSMNNCEVDLEETTILGK